MSSSPPPPRQSPERIKQLQLCEAGETRGRKQKLLVINKKGGNLLAPAVSPCATQSASAAIDPVPISQVEACVLLWGRPRGGVWGVGGEGCLPGRTSCVDGDLLSNFPLMDEQCQKRKK